MFEFYRKYNIGLLEYLYIFVMVIYMGQMTEATGRMVSHISGNPFAFLLPIVLTVILYIYRPISIFNKNLFFVLVLFFIWSGLIINKLGVFNNTEFSYYFFLFYSIIIAFLHVQIFDKKLLPLYEDVIVKLSILSLALWLYAVMYPTSTNFFRQFDETSFGRNVFYLFNWMDPNKDQVVNGLIRNSGFSWEPGRFSICVVIALFCNIARRGGMSLNFNTLILIITILSTLSTTGYVAMIVLYIVAFIHRLTFQKSLVFILVLIPTILIISRLNFVSEKIEQQMKVETNLRNVDKSIAYNKEKEDSEGDYVASLDRFTSMYFEWENVWEDPIIGYGRNIENSYFYKNVSNNFILTGGLVKVFSKHGIPLGLIIYIFLLISSVKIHHDYKNAPPLGLFILFLICSISYEMFTIPLFTAFWFYGIFHLSKSEEMKIEKKMNSEDIRKKLRKQLQR